METIVTMLALFYSLGSSVFVTAQQCLLLQQCSSNQKILVNSNHLLRWSFSGIWMPSRATFYRVPDGGAYNDSYIISSDDPNFEIEVNTLKLVNVSAEHEGRYYCSYDGEALAPVGSDCIAVTGRASLSCDNPQSTPSLGSCGSEIQPPTCTENIEVVRGSTLTFNPAISFVGNGVCQAQQEVDRIQLIRNETVVWAHNIKRNQSLSRDNHFQLIRDGTFPFVLALHGANDSDSGMYTLSVRIPGNPENCLYKTFHVEVIADNTPSLDLTTVEDDSWPSTSTTADPTTAAVTSTDATSPKNDYEKRKYNLTDPNNSDPVPAFSMVSMAAIGAAVSLIIVFVILVIIFVCVAGRNKNKSTKPIFLDDNSDRLSVHGEGFLQDCLYSPDDVRV